jgi:tetratricopeptide (TPR) repeat protein
MALTLPLPAQAQQKSAAPGLSPARADVAASSPRHGGVKPPLRCAALKGGATTPSSSQAKPFTQEQVVSMVRDGFGDESGAKLIEQRGIDFAPSEDFIQTLKAAGASEAFLNALRAAVAPGLSPAHAALKGGSTTAGPPTNAKKPLNQVQVFALLVGQVPNQRVAMLVQERGIDFEPTDDYLQEVRLAGGEDELISALKSAKVTRPPTVDPAALARQTEVRQHVARAGEFYRGKRYADAETEFRAAVQLTPESAELHADLGVVLGDKGDWDGEIAEEHEALRLDPNNELAHLNLGVALGRKRDVDGSITEAREAVRLSPNDDRAHANLGAALGDKGNWDGEIAEEREALRLNPNNELAHVNLGFAHGAMGDWDGEISEERVALRLNPNNPNAHNFLGVALGNKGDWDGEIAEHREALRLDPNNELAHVTLGGALGAKGDWDGEIAEEREALRINPNNEFAHVNLGGALGGKGDWDGEITEAREALRLNPKNYMAHFDLGVALAGKHDWDGLITEAREGLRLDPNNGWGHFGLGRGLEGKGDLPGALVEYRAAYTLDPKNAQFKQAYERLLQPSSPLGEAKPTDISGEWKSVTSGATFRVRVEQGHVYVERVVTEDQSKLGIFQLCDLAKEGDTYQGTCRSQGVDRWYDRWRYQWRTRACQFHGKMEFIKYSPSRIEGRLETQGFGEKWSDKDNSNCGERFPVVWTDFIWIRPN